MLVCALGKIDCRQDLMALSACRWRLGLRDESFDGAHLAEFEVALVQEFVVREIEQLKELIGEGFGHPVADGFGFTVRSA